jgi:hypothetical protein
MTLAERLAGRCCSRCYTLSMKICATDRCRTSRHSRSRPRDQPYDDGSAVVKEEGARACLTPSVADDRVLAAVRAALHLTFR